MSGALVAMLLLLAVEPIETAAQKGPVKAALSLSPAQPVIGDTVHLTLRVTAEKDVELLMPEFGQLLDRYAIIDYRTNDSIDEAGQTVVTQEYELQPARSGKQSIAPIMIEFVDRRPGSKPAPEDMDAYELLTDRLAFEVKSVLPDDAEAMLHPPLGELAPLPTVQETHRRWVFAAIGAAVVALAALIPLWLAKRRRARKRSAYDVAAERLRKLLAWPRSGAEEIDAFFVELSAIVRRYVEDRFELRAPELTTEEFMASMSSSPDLNRDHQALLRDFLRQADLVKFAHFVPTDSDIDNSVGTARTFLDETRYQSAAEAAHA